MHKIKFYPVDNGDTTLIKLSNNTNIQIDCKLRVSAEDVEDTTKYDVKKDLLNELPKIKGVPHLDLFILTHGDKDHCHGFEKHYYTGEPSKYVDNTPNKDKIFIEELCVTSMLFNNENNSEANTIRNEANRRKRLYDNNDTTKNDAGNRLVIIGYDGTKKFENVPSYIPGDIISKINESEQDLFSFFVHAPFKDTLITAKAEKDRNAASIVLLARFKARKYDSNHIAKVLLGGDADHYQWKKILDESKAHNNEDQLEFDIFLAPHHCSWTYFNDTKQEDNPEAKDYSLEILDKAKKGAFIIASSKIIKKHDKNPPHFEAKNEYVAKLESKDKFINTATHPNEDAPLPIIFEITSTGVKKIDNNAIIEKASIGGAKPFFDDSRNF